ncbi:MAG: hypothetical protein AAF081_18180 [Actinomycetota bacterium]
MSTRRFASSIIVIVGVVLASFGPAHAQSVPVESTRAGAAEIVAVDGETPVSSGGSDADFRLRLPVGSTCPGDTANDGFQTSGFIIPENEPVADLVFGIVNPLPEDSGRLFSLRDRTQPWMNENLPQNVDAGQPAVVGEFPVFTFATFLPGEIPEGRYRIGLTCSFIGRPSGGYWDALVDIAADADDQPGALRWTVVEADDTAVALDPEDGGTATTTWIVIGLGLAAVFFLIVSIISGRSRDAEPAKEHTS